MAYGVRHGMGVVPSPSAYKWLCTVEGLRGGVQSNSPNV